LRIYLHDATQPLTCGTPDIRVMVLGPPSRSIKDRGWMALTNLDQRRGSHLARLPLIARCQPLEFGEDSIRFDTASGKKLIDVVNLSDQQQRLCAPLSDNHANHQATNGTQDENWRVRFRDYRVRQT
jgi:hypothetical protein